MNDARIIRNENHQATFYPLLINTLNTGVFLVQDGLFQFVNPAAARTLGSDPVELVGKVGPVDLAGPDEKLALAEALDLCLRGTAADLHHSFRLSINGSRRTRVRIRGTRVELNGYAAVIGTVDEVIGHIDAHDELKETSDAQSGLFEEDLIPHYATTPDGTILMCNNAFAHLFGFPSKEEAMRVKASALFPADKDRATFVQLVSEEKRLKNHYAEYVRRDGKRLFVSESAVGDFDQLGNLVGIRGYILNQTDERQLEGQLLQSQRLETLGVLVGGIAHDFNNILTVLAGHTALMKRWQLSPERFSRSLEAVAQATGRGAHLAKQLLRFVRMAEVKPEPVNLLEVVQELVSFLKGTFPPSIDIHLGTEGDVPLILVDSTQLYQVLLNLCVNAKDAMPSGGTLTIFAKRAGQGVFEGRGPGVEASEYVLLRVADTGSGIDQTTLSHIFEPFFSTKKGVRATGLGLAVVRGIINELHGFINVESTVGKGTTFSLYLPMSTQPVDAEKVARSEVKSSDNAET